MGVISIPTADKPTQVKEATEQISVVDIDTPPQDELFNDDLSITNEALRLMPLKRFMGLDSTDMSYDKELKDIVAWAKEKGVKNRNQLWSQLKAIEYKLGVIDGNEAKVRKMHEYVRIDGQISGLVNKLGAITDGK